MSDRKTPNLFIVGAPKSGTTAMYEYLNVHPDIYMSPVKEPYFFGQDLQYHTLARMSSRKYLQLFADAENERWLGEASVTYLYSQCAAREIYDFNPDARIIIMLRNPVEMVHALHSQTLFSGIENIVDFEMALAAEEDRKKGNRIPKQCTIVDFLFYRDFGRYHDQVMRYLQVFGRRQVHILTFDDFKLDTASVYRDTLSFLGVNTKLGEKDFNRINRHKIARRGLVASIMKNKAIIKAGRLLVPVRGVRQRIVDELMIRWDERAPLALELSEQLRNEFRSDIKRLGKMIGRDLSHWYRHSSVSRGI